MRSMRLAMCGVWLTGCGVTTRVLAGPTVDFEGHVGFEIGVAQGATFSVAPGHAIGVLAQLGAGYQQGCNLSAALGADWTIVSPEEPQAQHAGLWPARLAYVGLRGGYRYADGKQAVPFGLALGAAGGVRRVGAASLLLGAEAECARAWGIGARPLEGGRCWLGGTVQLVNFAAFAADQGPFR